ncbi:MULTISPECIES: pentapeptide repeat-containing protein [unclassified Pseudomonas]|uniref:pentapeptide repeat-containing protein n=1 Tax=unclassified Pseudomonas TaxID=196821 RepID=UPI00119D6A69|nr:MULTISPECIES: pentapeptide repeat-containing protein [unclassified Pseudomonas]TWC27798.1 pentapeptide repeat protein [Pseudomonas sp. SJZ083]TWC53862.1 pentapeptide repeat protein [Pseudomonas sp. SJZ077]
MKEDNPSSESLGATTGKPTMDPLEPEARKALKRGNREVITDFYVSVNVENEPKDYAFKVYVRLNAKKMTLKNVSFQHSVFDACYFNNCVFDTCDFTGCRFIGCNLHQSAFSGCKFEYAIFERCQIDDDILEREAPQQENLKLRFARSLRMNFQQIGDAKAVNRAISQELDATSSYLKKSWSSSETYYRNKYPGWKKLPQFIKWLEFRMLDAIWGNGENTLKLLRSIVVVHLAIALYDTYNFANPWDLKAYLTSFFASPGVFFGISTPNPYPIWFSSIIAATRLVGFAFLTAILVKRFGRR